jgi:hypothetical protein
LKLLLQQFGAYRPELMVSSSYPLRKEDKAGHRTNHRLRKAAKWQGIPLTFQIQVSASLTWHLTIALDLAALAFVARQSYSLALYRKAYSVLPDCTNCGMTLEKEGSRSAGSYRSGRQGAETSRLGRDQATVIPCDRDVAIPLCPHLRSVGLFRFPLG